MLREAPHYMPLTFGAVFAASSLGMALSIALGEVASLEQVPLAYYVATFFCLGGVYSVIRFWTWLEDRQTKQLIALKEEMKKHVIEAFKTHNEMDDLRLKRLEDMIRSAMPRR